MDNTLQLPPNTYWVVPDIFLAGRFPSAGSPSPTLALLEQFSNAGIQQFIDLTQPFERESDHYNAVLSLMHPASRPGYQNFPIVDWDIPNPALMRTILDYVDTCIKDSKPIYLHCFGGRGRTGTVVGCWLVRHGLSGTAALERIRMAREHIPDRIYQSPETDQQREFVLDWEKQEKL